jgi:hypothetical protein
LDPGGPQFGCIEGVGPWRWIVVSAAYPHNKNDKIYSAPECAAMVRAALPNAIAVAAANQIGSIAMTVIGKAYRMPAVLCVRAAADGLGAARRVDLLVRWSLPDTLDRENAREACARLGLL